MSESNSRVLSFIQRAKQLTDSTKSNTLPQNNNIANTFTANPVQVSRVVPSPAGSRAMNSNTTSIKTDPIAQTRIPSPANNKNHKSSLSQVISPTFKTQEKKQYSRKGTPTSNSPILQVDSKPSHKSSTSQIFFPTSPSTSSSRLPLPKPPPSSSSSKAKTSPLSKPKTLSIQSTTSFKPARSSPTVNSPKPQTPNQSTYSRSSTPRSLATPLSSSPIPSHSQIPQISESKPPQLPTLEAPNLDSAIENLVKIRNQIDYKLKEQQDKESQMIQNLSKKLEKIKKSESRYENIEKAKM